MRARPSTPRCNQINPRWLGTDRKTSPPGRPRLQQRWKEMLLALLGAHVLLTTTRTEVRCYQATMIARASSTVTTIYARGSSTYLHSSSDTPPIPAARAASCRRCCNLVFFAFFPVEAPKGLYVEFSIMSVAGCCNPKHPGWLAKANADAGRLGGMVWLGSCTPRTKKL